MRGTKNEAISAPVALRNLGRRTLPALALIWLAAGSPSAVAEDALPLKEAIDVAGTHPVRFFLSNGNVVIGRIVKIGDDVLTIRRPSAGLLALAFPEITAVNIKTSKGELRQGRIMRMADGTIGWLDDDQAEPPIATAQSAERTPAAERAVEQRANVDADALTETGGPFIRLDTPITAEADALLDQSVDDEDSDAASLDVALTNVERSDGPAVSPDLPLPRLVVTADETRESDGLIYFRFHLSEPAAKSILVIYTMIDGSAVAPGDYSHRQGVVVFEPGETKAMIATSVIDDEVSEGAESFDFFVTADPASVIIDDRKIDAMIADDDG